jgi:hypothetical protein
VLWSSFFFLSSCLILSLDLIWQILSFHYLILLSNPISTISILSYHTMLLPHVQHALTMLSLVYIPYLTCSYSLASYYLLSWNCQHDYSLVIPLDNCQSSTLARPKTIPVTITGTLSVLELELRNLIRLFMISVAESFEVITSGICILWSCRCSLMPTSAHWWPWCQLSCLPPVQLEDLCVGKFVLDCCWASSHPVYQAHRNAVKFIL